VAARAGSSIEVFVWLTYLSTGIRCTIIRVTHVTAGTGCLVRHTRQTPRIAPLTARTHHEVAWNAAGAGASIAGVAGVTRHDAPHGFVRSIQVVGSHRGVLQDRTTVVSEGLVSRPAAVAHAALSEARATRRVAGKTGSQDIVVLVACAYSGAVLFVADHVACPARETVAEVRKVLLAVEAVLRASHAHSVERMEAVFAEVAGGFRFAGEAVGVCAGFAGVQVVRVDGLRVLQRAGRLVEHAEAVPADVAAAADPAMAATGAFAGEARSVAGLAGVRGEVKVVGLGAEAEVRHDEVVVVEVGAWGSVSALVLSGSEAAVAGGVAGEGRAGFRGVVEGGALSAGRAAGRSCSGAGQARGVARLAVLRSGVEVLSG